MTDDHEVKRKLPLSTLEALETEITEILASCQDFVDRDTKNKLKQINNGTIFDYDTNTNIEKLAQDMTSILESFKQQLTLISSDEELRYRRKIHDDRIKEMEKRKHESLKMGEREKSLNANKENQDSNPEMLQQTSKPKVVYDDKKIVLGKCVIETSKKSPADSEKSSKLKLGDDKKPQFDCKPRSFFNKTKLLIPPPKNPFIKLGKIEAKRVDSTIEKNKLNNVRSKGSFQKQDSKFKSSKISRESSFSKKSEKTDSDSVSHNNKTRKNSSQLKSEDHPQNTKPSASSSEDSNQKALIINPQKGPTKRSKTSIVNKMECVKVPSKTRNSATSEKPSSLILSTNMTTPFFNLMKTSSNSLSDSVTSIKKKNTILSKDTIDPLGILKSEVDEAISKQKTFTVRGCYPIIRQALLKRGWIEKVSASYRDNTSRNKPYISMPMQELFELTKLAHTHQIAKKILRSKMLGPEHQVDLYWAHNYDSYRECSDSTKKTLINRIRWNSTPYTNKYGLCEASRQSFWFHLPGVSKLNVPRSYRLAKEGDAEEFVKDFNMTAAMSLLKWVKTRYEVQEAKLMTPTGKVPLRMFDFAINECYKYLKRCRHEDIDQEIKEALSHEWNEFLEYFYKIVHVGNLFKLEDHVSESDMLRRVNYILDRIKEYYPYLDMDGELNIWILKPTNSCRGIGIHMCRTLKYVLDTVRANPNRRYIIQKYIERPLLIYNTKFDIRQWFLISSTVPITIWIYNVCYLRFSSQTYNLKKLHESIHLTNNSVQCKYRNTHQDPHLPTFCMWDSNEFKTYLAGKGYPTVYNEIIYPGMKQCITAAVLMHQENMEQRKNSFEVYGADFILTEDFQPWLLEINANPALHASTPVTARLCPKLMEDVIRVVVDYGRNRNAGTGNFELVYRGSMKKDVACRDLSTLSIEGKPLAVNYFYKPKWSPKERETETSDWGSNRKIKNLSKNPDNTDFGLASVTGMKETLHSLLEILRKEKERRKDIKRRSVMDAPPHPFPLGVETWHEKRKIFGQRVP